MVTTRRFKVLVFGLPLHSIRNLDWRYCTAYRHEGAGIDLDYSLQRIDYHLPIIHVAPTYV